MIPRRTRSYTNRSNLASSARADPAIAASLARFFFGAACPTLVEDFWLAAIALILLARRAPLGVSYQNAEQNVQRAEARAEQQDLHFAWSEQRNHPQREERTSDMSHDARRGSARRNQGATVKNEPRAGDELLVTACPEHERQYRTCRKRRHEAQRELTNGRTRDRERTGRRMAQQQNGPDARRGERGNDPHDKPMYAERGNGRHRCREQAYDAGRSR